MFWNDIVEIKVELKQISSCLRDILRKQEEISDAKTLEKGLNQIHDCIADLLESEDGNNTFNRLHDKLDSILADERRKMEAEIAIKTMDKFEIYMKNVDRLNDMVNEFKGCVSMARAVFVEQKKNEGSDV